MTDKEKLEALKAEISKLKGNPYYMAIKDVLVVIDTIQEESKKEAVIKVKQIMAEVDAKFPKFAKECKTMQEEKEDDVPEYSYFETIYKCGKKPHWNVGDTLAFYEFYSDREGENILGKVAKVEVNEEVDDWLYTFEDGSIYDEETLLNEETYKKK